MSCLNFDLSKRKVTYFGKMLRYLRYKNNDHIFDMAQKLTQTGRGKFSSARVSRMEYTQDMWDKNDFATSVCIAYNLHFDYFSVALEADRENKGARMAMDFVFWIYKFFFKDYWQFCFKRCSVKKFKESLNVER